MVVIVFIVSFTNSDIFNSKWQIITLLLLFVKSSSFWELSKCLLVKNAYLYIKKQKQSVKKEASEKKYRVNIFLTLYLILSFRSSNPLYLHSAY